MQIPKDGEVLVPVPEFTFEDVKSLKDYNEAKNFRIKTAPNGDEYVACRHVENKMRARISYKRLFEGN